MSCRCCKRESRAYTGTGEQGRVVELPNGCCLFCFAKFYTWCERVHQKLPVGADGAFPEAMFLEFLRSAS